MATKTITEPNRFTTRKDSELLLEAMKKASKAEQKKIVYSSKVEYLSKADIKKYADKFK
jgi:hypothetical protein